MYMKNSIIKVFIVMAISLVWIRCQQQNSQPNQPQQTQGTYFITATLNGTVWTADQPNNGCGQYIQWIDDVDYINDIVINYYYAGFDQDPIISPITQVLNGDLRVGFSGLVDVYSDYQNDNAVFYSSMTNVPTVYYQDSVMGAGPEISYWDSNNEYWSTRFGSQANSSFVLTTNNVLNGAVSPTQKMGGTFSCTMYKQNDPAQTKSVTNGSFMLLYEKNQ